LSDLLAGCNDCLDATQPTGGLIVPEDTIKRLIGTWRLVSAERHDLETGARSHVMGPGANGFINYGADGRMIVIVVGGPRAVPTSATSTSEEKEVLYDSLNAYAGTYSLNGNEMLHHVDTSWNEIWTGHDQKRFLKFDGEKLVLSGSPSAGTDGRLGVRVMTWEKVT
jgi:hypothetical protein